MAYLVIAALFYQVFVTTFLIIPVVLMLFLLAAGGAMLMGALNVFFRDFSHLTSVLLRALFYLTPIIYPPDLIGPKAAMFLRMNPVFYPVVAGRDVLYYGRVPAPEDWAIGFLAAGLVFCLGLIVFTSTENRFVYYA